MLSSSSRTPANVVAVEFTCTTALPSFHTPSTLKRKIPRFEAACVSSLTTKFLMSPLVTHTRAPLVALQEKVAISFGQTVTFPSGVSEATREKEYYLISTRRQNLMPNSCQLPASRTHQFHILRKKICCKLWNRGLAAFPWWCGLKLWLSPFMLAACWTRLYYSYWGIWHHFSIISAWMWLIIVSQFEHL